MHETCDAADIPFKECVFGLSYLYFGYDRHESGERGFDGLKGVNQTQDKALV